jgi:peptidylprolyl isomerase/peptidyl-prolyl cis-trans isomerase D
VRFSHIFLAYRGANPNIPSVRSKEQAEELADSLLNVVRRDPARFDSLAVQFSDDTETAEFGGDVNWLLDIPGNLLVKECIENPIGHIGVVETGIGYHVLKVTDRTPMVKKVRVAEMVRSIFPSEVTYNQIFTEASEFVANAADLDEFLAVGNEYNPRTAEIREMDAQVSVLEDSRSIVRWAFEDERELGDVSDVFELNDKLIIAAISHIKEEGTTSFEDKKEDLRPLVLNELKLDYLLEQASTDISGQSDINSIAQTLDSKVDSNDFITFASFSLPGYGPEPEVIGTIFSMETGQVSPVIKGRQGVFVVIVDEFVEPETGENPDFSQAVMTYESGFKSRVQNELMGILRDESDVEDNRKVYF